ncbi:MAG: two-component system response regulator [Candidatus Rokuibacteriota bacterium]|nr:MAG: two-component system response regulator [Candidatus Rokubacteria bacterium]
MRYLDGPRLAARRLGGIRDRRPRGRCYERSRGSAVIERGTLPGLCVLIVDDNDDVRELLQTCLEYMGAVTVPAESAGEALFLFQRLRPHIVLTDIAMPFHDGHWLLRQLRTLERTQRTPTPVVAMTALSGPGPAGGAARGEFDGWLTKPLDLDEMAVLVERLGHRRMAA